MRSCIALITKPQLSKEERMSLHQNLDGVSRLKGDLLAIAKSRKYKIRGFQTLPEGNMGFQVTTNRMRGRTAIGRFSFVKVKSCTSINWFSSEQSSTSSSFPPIPGLGLSGWLSVKTFQQKTDPGWLKVLLHCELQCPLWPQVEHKSDGRGARWTYANRITKKNKKEFKTKT